MTKRKYVEDSDGDDEDAESPVPPSRSLRTELGPGESTSHRSIDTGTASADVANQEIAYAPIGPMQPTPESAKSIVKQANASQNSLTTPNVKRSKMKRTLSNVESPSPRVQYGRQKVAQIKERDFFDFHGSSDGEVEIRSKARGLKDRTNFSKDVDDRTAQNPPNVSNPAIYPVSGLASITNSLPDRSSDSLKTRNANKMLNTSHSEIEMPPTTKSLKLKRGLDESVNLEYTSEDAHTSLVVTQAKQTALDPPEEPSSSASVLSRSKTIVVQISSPKQAQLQYDDMEDELSGVADIHPVGGSNPRRLFPQAPIPEKLLPSKLEAEHRSFSDSEDDDEIHTSRNRKRNIILRPTIDEVGVDEISEGAPQEQYLKRPTRSRSGLSSEELLAPTDFSKKPEKVAKVVVNRKSKLKRSKTTAFQELRSMESDEEDEINLPTKGTLNVKNASNAEKENLQNSSRKFELQADEHEDSFREDPEVQEKSEIPKPGKKRGRPKKSRTTEEKESNIRVAEELGERELACKKILPDDLLSTEKRSAQKAFSYDLHLEDAVDDNGSNYSMEEPTTKESTATNENILSQTTGNTTTAQRPQGPTKSPPRPCETNLLPETPKKVDELSVKGPERHSPISNGKMAYRVGLSKRARIQPLLRIVRK